MNAREISFKTNFGDVVRQYQCPHCCDIYALEDDKINEGIAYCWRCCKPYFQKLCLTNNFKFVREAIHRCKG